MCPSDGSRKPIDEVQVGDLVVATDPETGEQAAKVVEAVFVHEDEVYGLSIDGETITTTEDHPFWSVTDQQFERADQLAAGEQVLAADGTALVVTRPVFRTETTRTLAYNLTVGETHTYHVGETQTLVHNCPRSGGGAGELAASGTVDPSTVRFSQKGISRNFSSHGPVSGLVDGLRDGSINPADIPAIRLVKRAKGYVSLDNRRLYAFREAGVDIPYRMATEVEIAKESWKFDSIDGFSSIAMRGVASKIGQLFWCWSEVAGSASR